MNKVQLTGTLTKEPYQAAKGWVGATLAVKKSGSDFNLWVGLYAPSGDAAKAFAGAQKNEAFHVEGELDETKDKDGKKFLQVKVISANRVTAQKNVHNVHIDDSDIPF